MKHQEDTLNRENLLAEQKLILVKASINRSK